MLYSGGVEGTGPPYDSMNLKQIKIISVRQYKKHHVSQQTHIKLEMQYTYYYVNQYTNNTQNIRSVNTQNIKLIRQYTKDQVSEAIHK